MRISTFLKQILTVNLNLFTYNFVIHIISGKKTLLNKEISKFLEITKSLRQSDFEVLN